MWERKINGTAFGVHPIFTPVHTWPEHRCGCQPVAFGKVAIIGRLGPVLSKHLRGAFHHFQNIQAALFRERAAALTQRTATGAIAHILRHARLRLTDRTHGTLVIADVDAKRTLHKNHTWRHIYQALIRKLVLIVPKVSQTDILR